MARRRLRVETADRQLGDQAHRCPLRPTDPAGHTARRDLAGRRRDADRRGSQERRHWHTSCWHNRDRCVDGETTEAGRRAWIGSTAS